MGLKVTFLGHAGLYVESENCRIAIDPWLTDSSVRHPVLYGVTGHTTIDYLLPRARHRPEDLPVDLILLSHFHTHHAPTHDLIKLIESSPESVTISCPQRLDSEIKVSTQRLAPVQDKVVWKDIGQDFEWQFKDLTIKALTHTRRGHLAWFIQNSHGSILHVADPAAHRNMYDKRLDPLWLKFQSLRPDFLFASTGSHTVRGMHEDRPFLIESNMTPQQTAYLAHVLQPKCLAIIGIYNFSVFKNRVEYILPVGMCEEGVEWLSTNSLLTFHLSSFLPAKFLRFQKTKMSLLLSNGFAKLWKTYSRNKLVVE